MLKDFKPVTQEQLLRDYLKVNSSCDAHRIWGGFYNHRMACVLLIRDRVFEMLEDPKMNRKELRRRLNALCEHVIKDGC